MTAAKTIRGIRDFIAGNTIIGRIGQSSGPPGPISIADLLRSVEAQAVIGNTNLPKASSTQFGVVEVDGSTITASGGVISSVGGSGALTLLSSQTVSGAASVSFTSLLTSSYDQYILQYFEAVPGTNATAIGLQVSADNGSTWATTGYNWSYTIWGATTNFSSYVNEANSSVLGFTPTLSSTLSVVNSGEVKLFGVNNASTKKAIFSQFVAVSNDSNTYTGQAGGMYGTAEAVNAVRVIATTGTVSGTFRLYGVSP